MNKLLAEIRSGAREGSIISTESIESLSSEDTDGWNQLRKDLEDVGITASLFLQHRTFIVHWFQFALRKGAFNETTAGGFAALPITATNPQVASSALLEWSPREESMEQLDLKTPNRLQRAMQGVTGRFSISSKSDSQRLSAKAVAVSDITEGHGLPSKRNSATIAATSSRTETSESAGAKRISSRKSLARLRSKTSVLALNKSFPAPLATGHGRSHSLEDGLISPVQQTSVSTSEDRRSSSRFLPLRPVTMSAMPRFTPRFSRPASEQSTVRRQPSSNFLHDSQATSARFSHRGSWTPSYQEAYDRHQSTIKNLYYRRSAAEEAQLDYARKALRTGSKPTIDHAAPSFNRLASSGMEIPIPSPTLEGRPQVQKHSTEDGESFMELGPQGASVRSIADRHHSSAHSFYSSSVYAPPYAPPPDEKHDKAKEEPRPLANRPPPGRRDSLSGDSSTLEALESNTIHETSISKHRSFTTLQSPTEVAHTDSHEPDYLEHSREHGKTEQSKKSGEQEFDIELRDKRGCTRLHNACQSGQPKLVRFLIENGADVRLKNDGGQSPLDIAVSNGHTKAVQALLESIPASSIPEIWDSPVLHTAVKRKDAVMASLLIRHGADVNRRDANSMTALHIAAMYGFITIIYLLLQSNADISIPGQLGRTPLHEAVSWGKLDVVQILLYHGANVRARDSAGLTPLHGAVSSGVPDAVQMLLEHGADIQAQDSAGSTPLHGAVLSRAYEAVEILLRHGADVRARDLTGLTPLHQAVNLGDVATTKRLVAEGANIIEHSKEGKTPLHNAVSSGHSDAVRFLIDSGAVIDAVDYQDSTPLHHAILLGEKDIMHVLLEHGADVELLPPTSRDLLERRHNIIGVTSSKDSTTESAPSDFGFVSHPTAAGRDLTPKGSSTAGSSLTMGAMEANHENTNLFPPSPVSATVVAGG